MYTSFREHMIGQPANGNKDLIPSLTKQNIQDHYNRSFIGQNISVVVSGKSNHEKIVEISSKWFKKFENESSLVVKDSDDVPCLTPTMMT